MSQSFRHRPVVGYGKSEKKDKLAFHRKWRRKIANSLHISLEPDILPDPLEVANTRRWRKAPRGWYAETCKTPVQIDAEVTAARLMRF